MAHSLRSGGARRVLIPFQKGELEIWTAQSELAQKRGQVDAYVSHFDGNADRAEHWVAAEAEEWDRRAIEIL